METSLTTPIDGYTLYQSKRKPKNAITTAPTTPVTIKPLDIVKPAPVVATNHRVVTFINDNGVEVKSIWSIIDNSL